MIRYEKPKDLYTATLYQKLVRVVVINKPLWFKKLEKSYSFKSRELYLEENIIDLDDIDDVSVEEVGYLSS